MESTKTVEKIERQRKAMITNDLTNHVHIYTLPKAVL